MLTKILLGFTMLCNFATLFGIWIAYEAAPATLQERIGHELSVCGAIASAILYFFVAWFVMRSKEKNPEQSDGTVAEAGKPRHDALARKHGIYIGSAGIATQVIGDTLTVRLNILTCTNIELRHIRATLSTGLAGLEIALDPSAEPHRLLPWLEFEQVLEKTLTAEQMKKVSDWTDTVVINGKAKFEDHIEKEFSVRSALWRPALLPQDPQLRALRSELESAQTTIASLKKSPDDLRLRLLCFHRGATLHVTDATYFLKLSISCDEDTGIKDIHIYLTIGSDIIEVKPMDDLSGWIVRTPFKSKDYPYKSIEEHVMTEVSLWDKLQREGLRSGLVKDGWLGVKIEYRIPAVEISKVEIRVTKSKQREPCIFTFTAPSECEDVHVFDRAAFRDPS
jgi:hypothetical protein